MPPLRRALGYGLAVWVVPFVVAILIFPLRSGDRALFESVMPVALAATVVICALLMLSGAQGNVRRAGLLLGFLWMGMSVVDYAKDIGLTYLMMPVITTGIGSGAVRVRP